jgi:signal transduction histidine kinase
VRCAPCWGRGRADAGSDVTGQPLPLVVTDVAVTVVLAGSAVVTWRRGYRGPAALLLAAAVTWAAAAWLAPVLFWHRALLAHVVLAYPRVRPASRAAAVVVVAGYVLAVLLPAAFLADAVTAVYAAAVAAVAAWAVRGTRGVTRHRRRVALTAAAALTLPLVVGAAARLLTARDLNALDLVLYEAGLVAAVVLLVRGLAPPAAPALADLVIDLGPTSADALRDRLARELRDPDLAIGYHDPATGQYLDTAGHVVAVTGTGRSSLAVARDGRPFALLDVDSGVAADPEVVRSVQRATGIVAENAQRQADVLQRVRALEASRRRLLAAADDEQQRLARQLRHEVVRPVEVLRDELAALADGLADGPADGPADSVRRHVAAAVEQLDRTAEELEGIASGLRPRDLEHGLDHALRDLAGRVPVEVVVTGRVGSLPPDVELAAWFVCAEALSNAAKHAPGSTVEVRVSRDPDRLHLTVRDDGPGGATATGRGGLRGVADRVATTGGRLDLDSGGSGTRLVVELPLTPPDATAGRSGSARRPRRPATRSGGHPPRPPTT